MRRCVTWCRCRGTARRPSYINGEGPRCCCRGTARRQSYINGEGRRRVKIVTTPCRLYFATIFFRRRIFWRRFGLLSKFFDLLLLMHRHISVLANRHSIRCVLVFHSVMMRDRIIFPCKLRPTLSTSCSSCYII